MKDLRTIILEVENARQKFISAASGLNPEQENFKPSQEEWSIVDNIEYMVWAEQGGMNGIFKAMEAYRLNKQLWTGENPNQGLSIKEIVEKTWQKKEKVPESAKPKWGRPLKFWVISLRNCKRYLEMMSKNLNGMDIEKIIYPHPISGPLNIRQRMEFLRFHLERHRHQIENLKAHPDFPK